MSSLISSSATAKTAPPEDLAVATARSPSAGFPIASERATVSGRSGVTFRSSAKAAATGAQPSAFRDNVRFWVRAIVIILIVAALVTPPDVMSQLILFFAVYPLYEVSIFLIRRIEKRREAELRAEGLWDEDEGKPEETLPETKA